MTTTHPPTTEALGVCPPWCVWHYERRGFAPIHLGPSGGAFGRAPRDDCYAQLEAFDDERWLGPGQQTVIKLTPGEIPLADARLLAAHLLNLADVAEQSVGGGV